ncbi:Proteasome subunit alpha type-1 [Porphyridium purpureum]|uniref:Proteasome subunit alpha type n=1 Tax=Porphyridium purpureum TaxID=35688 RepID=A0A5J4YID2_PORPP|nr:Proteasome subunit alpha type-1 [Porphyridium purpureum]|eukprot:POR2134..scf271_22
MFRNQYDTDITTYSPQGRVHQIEYAMEAVKQGSAVVGLRSATHVVLATLKRSSSELASNQRKLFEIDSHVGIAIAGLTADARVLTRFMRAECHNHQYVYETPMPLSRLVLAVADKSQVATQRASKRPFGVGLLVAGYDTTGAHLYQTCPSGNYFEYEAFAIGARSQSAKTYLEKHFESFAALSLEELCRHAILALQETVASSKDTELTTRNTALAFVGRDTPWTMVEDDSVEEYLLVLDAEDELEEGDADAARQQPQQPPAAMDES